MAFETILVEKDGWVSSLTLARPSSGNAINERMAFELGDASDQLSRDDDVRVVIVTGQGDAFCRGADASTPQDRVEASALEALRSLKVADRIAAMEKPVIAALNGDAMDQGLELALACDIRIAAAHARFGLTQVKSGLIPWDGGTQRLPRLVGRGRAMELILTSRTLDAQEAVGMGLVNEMVQADKVLSRAREVALLIAGHGPIAARYLKEAVLKGLDLALEQGLRLEADLSVVLQSTADRAEGIRSFLERRPPRYRGQ